MKRSLLLIVLLVGGTLASGLAAAADETSAPAKNWLSGSTTLTWLGRGNVASSKFEEYRTAPRGLSLPDFSLAGHVSGLDFALTGENASRRDQRFTGYVNSEWFKVTFDYNQIMHNIGFGGRTLFNETAPGVWSMSSTLRGLLQTTWESTPSATKTYPWLLDFWGPSLTAGSTADVSLQRNRGTYTFELGEALGFDLNMTYFRETRRGAKDTTPVYVSSQIFELPTPTDYLTQDFGLSAALNRKWGNVHGGYNYNWFKNNVPLMLVDNPLRATDAVYGSNVGGPALGHNVMAPDNSASTFSLGGMAKIGKSTRLFGDVAFGQWKQNAAFFPYTFNTVILTPSGERADWRTSLPKSNLNGKIETTTMNVSFLTRPLRSMYLNVRYRSYDFNNKTPEIVSPGYVSWDRSWSTSGNTSIPYGYKTGRFETVLGYNFGKLLSLEGVYRQVVNDRTFREAEKTTEKAFSLSAIAHGSDWALLRITYENAKRAVSGIEDGETDLNFDLAKRDSQKVGLDLELTPLDALTFVISYFDRKATYQNPSWGYQSARYTTFGGEVNYQAKSLDATVYFTAEKNKDGHRGYQSISSVLEWYTAMADDKTDSIGGIFNFKIVPDKWDLALNYRYQKVNGFLDLEGSAAIQATRAGNGGIKDIPDFDDTSISSFRGQLTYALSADMSLGFGVWSDNYDFNDASIQTGLFFPAPGVFTLSPNYGSYKVTAVYVSLTFHL
jgi:hypothetical protein